MGILSQDFFFYFLLKLYKDITSKEEQMNWEVQIEL